MGVVIFQHAGAGAGGMERGKHGLVGGEGGDAFLGGSATTGIESSFARALRPMEISAISCTRLSPRPVPRKSWR